MPRDLSYSHDARAEFPAEMARDPEHPISLVIRDTFGDESDTDLGIKKATALRDELTEAINKAVTWQAEQVRIIPAEELREGDKFKAPKWDILTCKSARVVKAGSWDKQVVVNVVNSYALTFPIGQPVRLISRKDDGS